MFDTITIYTITVIFKVERTGSNVELCQDKICTMGFIVTINSAKTMFEE